MAAANTSSVAASPCGVRTWRPDLPKVWAGRQGLRPPDGARGRRVVPRVDCDVDYEEPFERSGSSGGWLREHGDDLAGAAAAPGAETTSIVAPTAVLGTRGAPVGQPSAGDGANATGSAKAMHYEFVWPGSAVQYAPGDSFAVTPENNPAEVAAVLALLGLSGDEHVDSGDGTGTLRDAWFNRDLQVSSGCSPR